MFNGKKTCKILKEIRSQIAAANDIELVTEECKFRGECSGTCPKCEAEVRYLEQQLYRRQMMGKAVVVAGVSMGVLSANASGNTLMDSPVAVPDSIVADTIGQIDINTAKYIIEGIVYDDIEPLMMATVYAIDNHDRIVSHAVTDINGHYALGVNELPVKLRCNYVGYKTTNIEVTEENYQNVNIHLRFARISTTGITITIVPHFKIVDKEGNFVKKFEVISNGETIFDENDLYFPNGEDDEDFCYIDNHNHVNEKVTIKAPGYKTKKIVLSRKKRLQTIVLKHID